MYHPAKVIEVFRSSGKNIKGANKETQALLEMWDENVFTFLVDPKIATSIKAGDIVLVDYAHQHSPKIRVFRHRVTKIIRGEPAKKLWKKYKDFLAKKKPAKKASGRTEVTQAPVSYIG